MILIALIGLLFFGKRLPEVGKSVAGAIVNFKKGLKEAHEEIEKSSEASETRAALPPEQTAAAPSDAKFDPYTGKPIERPKFDPYTGKPIEPTTVTTGDLHEQEHVA
jgi:sec-independent protein translocase protein TatA